MKWWIDWTKLELRELVEPPKEPIDITINYPSLEILLVYIPLIFGMGVLGSIICWWVDNKFEFFLDHRMKVRELRVQRERLDEMWHP